MIGRLAITDISPEVSCGRWPARAVVGEAVTVSATVFREGHDALGATVALTPPAAKGGCARLTPMWLVAAGTDRWSATVSLDAEGLWSFVVQAWSDPVDTWRHTVSVKVEAGQDVALELEEGARLLERAAANVPAGRRHAVTTAAASLRDGSLDVHARTAPALHPAMTELLDAHPLRDLLTDSDVREIWVDRARALCGSWYELFPRSEGASLDPPRSGTFVTAAKRLPAVAAMGFDIVYLPPVHPVGRTFRKGPNNTLSPGPDDPGSPWAVGSTDGGHDAVHPDLGTLADFDAFVARTRELGMEVALDLALQASPDHPWAAEHPEWFTVRADGSIAYAENPPKKYQDIYPVSFDTDPDGIYAEVLRIVRHWMAHGVRIFRVDNPHTKPVRFWEWLIAEVKKSAPDVLFLAEAFTRPAMMHMLARVGFTQSYTYFTWRTGKEELEDYLTELTTSPVADYMRPNLFVNTPDILPASLQYGGPPVFKIRAVLAATLSPTWGVYAGYELYEAAALRAGSEEYLDSEKYQYRPRDWGAAEAEGRSLAPYITVLNRVRREHPALQRLRGLHFHEVDNPEVIAYSRRLADPADPTAPGDVVLVVVNLDPHAMREAFVRLDLPELGLGWSDRLTVTDQLGVGETYEWGERSYVRLDPFTEPAHVFVVSPAPGRAGTPA